YYHRPGIVSTPFFKFFCEILKPSDERAVNSSFRCCFQAGFMIYCICILFCTDLPNGGERFFAPSTAFPQTCHGGQAHLRGMMRTSPWWQAHAALGGRT